MNRKDIKLLLNEKKETLLMIIPLLLGLYLRAQTLKWHRIFAYDPYFYYRQAVYFANGGHIHDIDPMIVTTIRRFSDNEYFLPILWAYLGKIVHVDLWTLGIYLPLIIFVAQIIVVYKIGKDAFNWKVGFFAALFLSVMGAHVYRTHAGGIWKDTLGSLFMLMFLHATILILKEEILDRKKALMYGTYLVLSLYLSIITFDGFGEFSLVVSVYLILAPLIAKPRKNEFLIAILMVPALVLGGMSVGTYWPWSDYPLKEIYLFIPFLVLAVITIPSLILGCISWDKTKSGKRNYSIFISVSILFTVSFLFKLSPHLSRNSMYYQIYGFINYLLKPEIIGLSAQSTATTINVLYTFFSSLLIFSILGSIVGGYHLITSSKKNQKRFNLLFLMLFIVSSFLGIAAIRLTYLMSFGIAFIATILFEYLTKVLKTRLPDKNKSIAILFILLLISTVPPFMEARKYTSMPPLPNNEWLEAMKWMGNNIPNKTVFNWWDWGHWIQASGVKTTSDNIYQRGNEYAWFIRVPENNSYNLVVKTQELAKENTGEDTTISYVLVSRDLLLKLDTLNRYYPKDKAIRAYIFTIESVVGNTVTYTEPNGAKIVIQFEANDTKGMLIYRNYRMNLKNIVIELPYKKNLNYQYGQSEYITYVTPNICFLLPSDLEDTTLVRLLILEQSKSYELAYDNGYIKIYKVKNKRK
ncbi:hypothetical protein [Thermococcus sp. 5-4]|uniref:hypothetical protein n=1 Tax=Thermococcus sp. 5-4 TaxID=2008440 RepID=UPI000B4A04EE|nr:hypothetical protein [Thermococcus sp. 5-4]ASA78639.1 hypothetical protein CDI07_00005 [Thermococcus sp. 5-4]